MELRESRRVMMQPLNFSTTTIPILLVLLVISAVSTASSAPASTFPSNQRQQTCWGRRCTSTSFDGLPVQSMRLHQRGFDDDHDDILSFLHRLRGGSDEKDTNDDEDDESDDSDSSEDEKEEEEEEEEDEVEEDEDEASANPLSSVVSMEPVPVSVQTSVGNVVLDQTVELTVHPSRNIGSIKQSIRRTLPGKPPVACQVLKWQQHGGNRILDDDIVVNELLEELEEDDIDDDDEIVDEEGGSSKRRLVLQLDMVPPVDPKFVAPLSQQIRDMSTSELLDAYAANEASLYQNAALLLQEQHPKKQDVEENDDDDEEGVKPTVTSPPVSVTTKIKDDAVRIRRDLEEQLLTSDEAKRILQQDDGKNDPGRHPNLQERQVRGQRVRQTAQGGVKTTVKRVIQRNLNVNWADTIRHFLLFLFFGWFGGRTPTSRAILLLGAPSVFLLQARPVKLWIKQAIYTLTDHPPSIFLSLLPAPRQAILSHDITEAMKTLYGDYIEPTEVESLLEKYDDVHIDESMNVALDDSEDDDDDDDEEEESDTDESDEDDDE